MPSRYWYLLFVPLFAVISVVEFYPFVYSVYLSVIDSNGNIPGGNYGRIFTDPAFWNSVNISMIFSVGSTVLVLAMGLGLTFLVTQRVPGTRFFEAVYTMPLAVAPIVVGTLWSPSAIWDDISTFAHFVLRLPYVDVLSPFFFFPMMVISETWEWAPLIMLVCLSIINSMPKEISEGAIVHGASHTQLFRLLYLPTVLRSPVLQFVVVLRFIDALRAFEIPLAWSNWVGYPTSVGSPVDTLSLYLYKLLFNPSFGFPIGLMSAIAVVLFIVTLVGAGIMFRLVKTIGG